MATKNEFELMINDYIKENAEDSLTNLKESFFEKLPIIYNNISYNYDIKQQLNECKSIVAVIEETWNQYRQDTINEAFDEFTKKFIHHVKNKDKIN